MSNQDECTCEREAIKAAWDVYSEIRDTSESPEETFGNGFRAGEQRGRREVIRGLYHQLTPEEALKTIASVWVLWASVGGQIVTGAIWLNSRKGKPSFEIFLEGTPNGKRKEFPLEKCEFLLCLKDQNEFPTPDQVFSEEPSL